jgi:hypothetical protein
MPLFIRRYLPGQPVMYTIWQGYNIKVFLKTFIVKERVAVFPVVGYGEKI